MSKQKVLLIVLMFIMSLLSCSNKDIISIINNDKIDFDQYDFVENLYFEYGQNNNKKCYKYNIRNGIKEETSALINDDNNVDYSEIIINNNSVGEIGYIYDAEQKILGIAYLDINGSITKKIVTWDELNNQFKSFYGFSQLHSVQQNDKLIFHIMSSYLKLVSIDLIDYSLTEIVEYKPIDYQYYYNNSYILKDDNIFVIDKYNKIVFYDTINEKLYNTNCYAYNFSVSDDGNFIYFINLDNELCIYNMFNDTSKVIVSLKNKVERIEVDKTNNFLLLVETLNKGTFIGIDTSKWFNQNELNLYEITTGKCLTIQKHSLFNIIFNAKFVD